MCYDRSWWQLQDAKAKDEAAKAAEKRSGVIEKLLGRADKPVEETKPERAPAPGSAPAKEPAPAK
jgi:hypothetical protein